MKKGRAVIVSLRRYSRTIDSKITLSAQKGQEWIMSIRAGRVCVFGENISEEQIKEVVMEYLRENEYDDTDDSASLHTAEEIEEAAEMIVNGGTLDCDMDCYWIDDVDMYV